MPKYLKTKDGSLESAVLEAVSAAQQAAIAIAKKEKGEKPKNEEKTECPQCEGKGCDHCEGKGYHTAEELSAKQKKIDFNKNGKVDGDDLAKLRAKKDKKEEVKEETLAMKAAKYISDMWTEASKDKKSKGIEAMKKAGNAKADAEADERKKKRNEEKAGSKTMTGKPMDKVEVAPSDKED